MAKGGVLSLNGATGMVFTTKGKVPLTLSTVSQAVASIAKGMALRGELTQGPISMIDVRRTCETRLSALGISKDLRAQLLSHGLGGVQDRHYDKHDYLDEKIRALTAWEAYLESLCSRLSPA